MDNFTTAAMPKIAVYPACSECQTPYVLRKNIVFAINLTEFTPAWLWQRDCKHRKSTPILQRMESTSAKPRKKARKK